MRMHQLTVGLCLALTGCGSDLYDEVGSVEQSAMSVNAMSVNAMSANAMSANAMSANAMSANAMSANAMESIDVSMSLHDPLAQVFMKYLVSCALYPTDEVLFKDIAHPA